MRAKNRIRNRKGFTLAETLLAVLILLLVSSVVAAGMPAVKQAYEKVVLASNAELMLSTAVATLRDELGTAWDVQEVAGGGVIYYSADTGNRSKLYVDTATHTIKLTEYSEKTAAENLLFGSGGSANPSPTLAPLTPRDLVYQADDDKALQLICDSIKLDPVNPNTVKITGLCVKAGSVTLAQWGGAGESIASLYITVFSTKTEESAGS